MTRLICIMLALIGLAVPALAQDSEARDRGYIQAFLEDNLSGAGRDVRITGFSGALSSQASIEELTIADKDGVWITLKGIVLDWNRGDLLGGRLNITSLTAKEILLPRLPKTEEGLSPEATVAQEFSLPDLPVSVEIGEFGIGRVRLGKAVMGEKIDITVKGSMSLAGGEGNAKLAVARADGRGQITLDASFVNETEFLTIDLNLEENADGIAATLLNIPGRPALTLAVAGKGPLSAFEADLKLTSDGELRLSGAFATQQSEINPDIRGFSANLVGNLAPLIAPQFRGFVGSDSTLDLVGVREDTGALEISEFALKSGALVLDGELGLGADRWPTHFALTGKIGDGTRLQLPVSGPATFIVSADISATYDAEQGDRWQADVAMRGFEQDALSIGESALSANGTISRDDPQSVVALMSFVLGEVAHTDEAMMLAMGPRIEGSTRLTWQPETPLVIRDLDLRSGDVRLTGSGTLDGLAEGFPASGSVRLIAQDLSRFALLAKRDLGGSSNTLIEGNGALLGGAFDLRIHAQTTDLVTDTPRLDPLLTGRSVLNASVMRDETGTSVEGLSLKNASVTLDASGKTDEVSGIFDLSAALTDLSLVEPKLTGPADVETSLAWVYEGDVTLRSLAIRLADAAIEAEGVVAINEAGMPARGKLSGTIGNLGRFAALAGRNLGGSLDFAIDGNGTLQGRTFDTTAEVTGRNIRSGIAQLDKLLVGDVALRADLGRTSEALDIRSLIFDGTRLSVSAKAVSDSVSAPLQVTARLSDLGLFTPAVRGPAEARGTINILDADARNMQVNLNADGPGGTRADIDGTIRDYGAQMDLGLNGNAPMALANSFVSPRSVQGNAAFDLRVSGAPSLASLSGSVRSNDGRVVLPALGIVLENIGGTVQLANARAQVVANGQFRSGGTFQLTGPIALAPPFQSEVTVVLNNAKITDNYIYTTTVNGPVSLVGPLTAGARVTGTLNLGETEIRIPSAGVANSVLIDNIRHVNEPARVRQTRRWAGLIKTEQGRPAQPLALDLTINAPRRVFVRGRGLDAELGGLIRLRGTTADVNPSGFLRLIRGRLDILGKRLILTEGLVDLRGALDPYVRFVAETAQDDVIVRIVLEGLASEIEVSFESDPDLPEEEIVSRLLLGRGLDKISPFQAAQLASAVATLAGRGNNDVVGRLRNSVGLSDLDVTQTEEGGTEVRAGAYISDKVYSEVTADSEGRREINLNLDVSRNVTIKGGLDNEGGTGLGIFFEKDY